MASADAKLPLDYSLSFLKMLQSNTSGEKSEVIPVLHRRVYYRSAEMPTIMQRAGALLTVLASVASVVETCES